MESVINTFSNDWNYIVRLLVAMVLGGLVGFERQKRGRSAGLRTNILVCIGSAAIIITFQKLSSEIGYNADSLLRMDPARAAAGVITGIGFLGAGTIIKSQDFILGLTTAASIWVVSAVGVTIGLGEYTIAIALTFLVLMTLYIFHRIPMSSDHYSTINLEWHGDLVLLDEVIENLKKEKIQIKHSSVSRQPNTGKCDETLNIRFREKIHKFSIFEELQSDLRFDEVSWH